MNTDDSQNQTNETYITERIMTQNTEESRRREKKEFQTNNWPILSI